MSARGGERRRQSLVRPGGSGRRRHAGRLPPDSDGGLNIAVASDADAARGVFTPEQTQTSSISRRQSCECFDWGQPVFTTRPSGCVELVHGLTDGARTRLVLGLGCFGRLHLLLRGVELARRAALTKLEAASRSELVSGLVLCLRHDRQPG